MTKNELNNLYFKWMHQLVCNNSYSKVSYKKLINHLHNVDFDYSIPTDGNRAEDGMDLRYRFGYEKNIDNAVIASYLDDRPCSVLEMMIALAIRCEHIMENQDIGDRTGQWFWNMMVSLGLNSMTDSRYDRNYVNDVIHKFLNREYKRNGEGGLFTVKNYKHDLRTTEIWYQMCWYLEEID